MMLINQIENLVFIGSFVCLFALWGGFLFIQALSKFVGSGICVCTDCLCNCCKLQDRDKYFDNCELIAHKPTVFVEAIEEENE